MPDLLPAVARLIRRMIAAADPERLPWPDDWFADDDPTAASRCVKLWSAAFMVSAEQDLFDAIGWLDRTGTPHFSFLFKKEAAEVASLAGLNPEAVFDRLRAALTPMTRESLIAVARKFSSAGNGDFYRKYLPTRTQIAKARR